MLMDLSNLTDGNNYPNGMPVASKLIIYNGKSAYDYYRGKEWSEGCLQFLREVAAYHCAAPCYEGKGAVFVTKFQKVKVFDAYVYLVANALRNGIEIFKQ